MEEAGSAGEAWVWAVVWASVVAWAWVEAWDPAWAWDPVGAWVDEGEGKGEWAEHDPGQGLAGTVSAPVAGRGPHIKREHPATT
jgi:hypothetical protein